MSGERASLVLDGAICCRCEQPLDDVAGMPTVCPSCRRSTGVNRHGEPIDHRKAKVMMTVIIILVAVVGALMFFAVAGGR